VWVDGLKWFILKNKLVSACVAENKNTISHMQTSSSRKFISTLCKNTATMSRSMVGPPRYVDMDVHNRNHINYVVKLCKRNSQNFYNGVFIHLNQALPPWVKSIEFDNAVDYAKYVERVEDAKIFRKAFDTGCMLTLVGPQVVGFLLYQIDNAGSTEVLYVLVDKDHRRMQHGSKMLQACVDRHESTKKGLFERGMEEIFRQGDRSIPGVFCSMHRNASLTCSMHRNASLGANLAFYTKNGFEDLSKVPEGLAGCCYQTDPDNFLAMVWTGDSSTLDP